MSPGFGFSMNLPSGEINVDVLWSRVSLIVLLRRCQDVPTQIIDRGIIVPAIEGVSPEGIGIEDQPDHGPSLLQLRTEFRAVIVT
jgi:hypothetical protein